MLFTSPAMEDYKKLNLFSFIREKGLDSNGYISELTVKRREDIYLPGQPLSSMYEIVQGVVKLGAYDDEGSEVVYDVVVGGDFFGNLKYLNGQFSEFARPLVKTRLRLYPLDFFRHLIVYEPEVSEWFNYYAVKRWCNAETKLFRSHARTSKKVEDLLHAMNITIQDADHQHFNLLHLLTRQDIGDLVGASRQTVSSALKKFNQMLLTVPAGPMPAKNLL